MPTTVAGIYKEGKIELLAAPTGVREGPVLVTLQELTRARPEPCLLPYGQYQGGRESTEEDFEIAEPERLDHNREQRSKLGDTIRGHRQDARIARAGNLEILRRGSRRRKLLAGGRATLLHRAAATA